MEPAKGFAARSVFGDLTNITRRECPANQVTDSKERKRQRERARYASLTEDQKSANNKRRREARQLKNGNALEGMGWMLLVLHSQSAWSLVQICMELLVWRSIDQEVLFGVVLIVKILW